MPVCRNARGSIAEVGRPRRPKMLQDAQTRSKMSNRRSKTLLGTYQWDPSYKDRPHPHSIHPEMRPSKRPEIGIKLRFVKRSTNNFRHAHSDSRKAQALIMRAFDRRKGKAASQTKRRQDGLRILTYNPEAPENVRDCFRCATPQGARRRSQNNSNTTTECSKTLPKSATRIQTQIAQNCKEFRGKPCRP